MGTGNNYEWLKYSGQENLIKLLKVLKGTENVLTNIKDKIYFNLSFLMHVFLSDPFILDILSHEEGDDNSTGSDSPGHQEHSRIADHLEENFNLFVKT